MAGRHWAAAGVGALAASAAFAIWRTRVAERKNPPLGSFIEVDGVRLHVVELGSGDPLVLLHGDGSLVQDFLASGLVDRAARDFRVILIDRPGYGWSTRPGDRLWTPAAQADLVAAAIARLGGAPAHILGHSWGTMVAVALALRHSDLVRSLTLEAGYYYPTLRLDAVVLGSPALPVIGAAMRYTVSPVLARALWPRFRRKIFAPSAVPARFRVEFPAEMAMTPSRLRAAAEDAALLVPGALSLRRHYGALGQPVSIVAGDGDRLVSTRHQSERLHRELPESRLRIVRGAGHMVHHIDPAAVYDAVLWAAARRG